MIHLLRITSLDTPYMAPIYPFRWEDLKYSLFRLPEQLNQKRPISNRPLDKQKEQVKN
ncbi:spore germination protein [Bacillus carboniphilus]|uniref:Spore germination protein n=1 Tax=Bacillus carboniphilus TaxID=86663 RepID=A0ABY9JZU1_9BACI|nr:spore germination protein [Bacillus carboniphilus]WLR43156.1 spore germination protein [Bacillus carboniphilus]